MKRKIEILVLSDLHLGSKTCKSKELLNYLKSIKPQVLILNGDILNTHNLKSLPLDHLKIVNRLMKMMTNGTRIYYLTGSSDSSMRRFSDFSSGQLHLRDQLVLQLGGKKYWFFHGDALDSTFPKTSWLKTFLSKYLPFFQAKNAVKTGKLAEKFEAKALKHADTEGCDAIVCGYTHQPKIVKNETTSYLNSGDWVENCTALEYNFGEWALYKYDPIDYDLVNSKLKVTDLELDEDEMKILQSEKEAKKAILQKPKEYVVIRSHNTEDWAHNEQIWDGIEY
jgi:UDP-2,3-diacylglucosamine pyrophosphatase LpxH